MASDTGCGNSVENLLAPAEARKRAGYSAWSTEQTDEGYGLAEFLQLCAAVHADPWVVVPTAVSVSEMQELVEYLSAPAKGRAAWTAKFGRIHLELGNETWNSVYKGETIEYPEEYGHRVGGDVSRGAAERRDIDAKRFDLMAGGQSGWPGRNQQILRMRMANADTLAVAPYLLHDIPAGASTDAIFGALFAQPERWSEGGVIAQNLAVARAKRIGTSIYEDEPAQHGGFADAGDAGCGGAVGWRGRGDGERDAAGDAAGVRSQAMFSLGQWHYKRSDGLQVPLWGAVVDMGVTYRRRPQFLAAALVNTAVSGRDDDYGAER